MGSEGEPWTARVWGLGGDMMRVSTLEEGERMQNLWLCTFIQTVVHVRKPRKKKRDSLRWLSGAGAYSFVLDSILKLLATITFHHSR